MTDLSVDVIAETLREHFYEHGLRDSVGSCRGVAERIAKALDDAALLATSVEFEAHRKYSA